MRILVVEDDAPSRLLVGGMLRRLGHEPVLPEDGHDALSRLRREHFPVVILEWPAPDMDVLELCGRIREDRPARRSHVVLLAAADARKGYFEGLAAGADDILVRPVDVDRLEVRLCVAERSLRLQGNLRVLEGLLPICPRCGRAREGQAYRRRVEAYVRERTAERSALATCPACREDREGPGMPREAAEDLPPG